MPSWLLKSKKSRHESANKVPAQNQHLHQHKHQHQIQPDGDAQAQTPPNPQQPLPQQSLTRANIELALQSVLQALESWRSLDIMSRPTTGEAKKQTLNQQKLHRQQNTRQHRQQDHTQRQQSLQRQHQPQQQQQRASSQQRQPSRQRQLQQQVHQQMRCCTNPAEYRDAIQSLRVYLERAAAAAAAREQQTAAMQSTADSAASDYIDSVSSLSRRRHEKRQRRWRGAEESRGHRCRDAWPPEADLMSSTLTTEDVRESDSSADAAAVAAAAANEAGAATAAASDSSYRCCCSRCCGANNDGRTSAAGSPLREITQRRGLGVHSLAPSELGITERVEPFDVIWGSVESLRVLEGCPQQQQFLLLLRELERPAGPAARVANQQLLCAPETGLEVEVEASVDSQNHKHQQQQQPMQQQQQQFIQQKQQPSHQKQQAPQQQQQQPTQQQQQQFIQQKKQPTQQKQPTKQHPQSLWQPEELKSERPKKPVGFFEDSDSSSDDGDEGAGVDDEDDSEIDGRQDEEDEEEEDVVKSGFRSVASCADCGDSLDTTTYCDTKGGGSGCIAGNNCNTANSGGLPSLIDSACAAAYAAAFAGSSGTSGSPLTPQGPQPPIAERNAQCRSRSPTVQQPPVQRHNSRSGRSATTLEVFDNASDEEAAALKQPLAKPAAATSSVPPVAEITGVPDSPGGCLSCDIPRSRTPPFSRLYETLDRAHRRIGGSSGCSGSGQLVEASLPLTHAAAGDCAEETIKPKDLLRDNILQHQQHQQQFPSRQRACIHSLNQKLLRSPFVTRSDNSQQSSLSPEHLTLQTPACWLLQPPSHMLLDQDEEDTVTPLTPPVPDEVIKSTTNELVSLSQNLQLFVLQINEAVNRLNNGLSQH